MRRTAVLLAGMVLLGGLGLAELRAATARFHRFDVAGQAGYTFLFEHVHGR
jgi:hypothetical protein